MDPVRSALASPTVNREEDEGAVMLDLIIGTKHKPHESNDLIQAVRSLDIEGSLYVGYPILAGPDERHTVDALLVSIEFGVVIFDVVDSAPEPPDDPVSFWAARLEAQDELVRGLMAKLVVHRDLTKGRRLGFEVECITFGPEGLTPPAEVEGLLYANHLNLEDRLKVFSSLKTEFLRPLNAAIERVSTIKPRNKRSGVTRPDSRGAIVKAIEKQIANLDRWQKRGAIESPEGPQRIRGLAGSGKTVVLALKAAYLHSQHPEWTIFITYQTRSLYEQFRDLVRRFCFESINDEPDWSRIKVLPAWGSVRDPGVYSEIAAMNGAVVRDWNSARATFGRKRAFEGICEELLPIQRGSKRSVCDAILIDEAQDFPASFFQLILESVPDPKRIVWAYDELQNLNETTMPPLATLFGENERGVPRVDLTTGAGEPHRDVILPKCYRNPPWCLTIAHGLGFGTCREEGLVQSFDEPLLWDDIGYEVVNGSLEPGCDVELRRKADASPEFFAEMLSPTDAFLATRFDNRADQLDWLVTEVKRNLTEDELEPEDILIILPNPVTAPEDAGPVVAALVSAGVRAHIAGVSTARDQFFVEGSVTVSGIYRAKGNEAAMVYLLNADYCARGAELLTRRNTLFTAITRSRAWVRVAGVGDAMDALLREISAIIDANYSLRYRVPTAKELATIRSIHRDRTDAERKKVEATKEKARSILEELEAGHITTEDLPADVRKRLGDILLPKR